MQVAAAAAWSAANTLGSDAMAAAPEGYGQIKLSGPAHGLDELRREIGGRFARSRKPATAA